MKLLIVAETIDGASALEQFLTEQGYTVLMAPTLADAIATLIEHGDIDAVLGDRARLRSVGGAPFTAAIDANELLRNLNLVAQRPQRFDVAHHQLRDYVDQRARWLVKIDEQLFDGLASTP